MSYHTAVRNFLDQLNDQGILYCHFKSNEHLTAGLCGKTDLDIIIATKDYQSTLKILITSNFKFFRSGFLSGYPGVEDWIGFDSNSGRLAHVHLHWQFVLGEPNLKGYRLPWELTILNNRVWDNKNRIYTSSPEVELILLLTRAALKFRIRSLIKMLFYKAPLMGNDLLREYKWLTKRVNTKKLSEILHLSFSPNFCLAIEGVMSSDFTHTPTFFSLRRNIKHFARPWRTYNSFGANVTRWYREYRLRIERRILRQLNLIGYIRRMPSTGGILVAVLGSDGSGKSTQVKDLCRWLSWKIDVTDEYFGSGEGRISWHRSVLRKFQQLIRYVLPKGISKFDQDKTSSRPIDSRNIFVKCFIGLYAISLALEKRSKINRAIKLRNRGWIIITDRYPQNQLFGYNDGPLLQTWLNQKGLWPLIAKAEMAILRVFSDLHPDLVLKLTVSASVASARKPQMLLQDIQKKIEAVKNLDFLEYTEVISINADLGKGAVQHEMRKAIWNKL